MKTNKYKTVNNLKIVDKMNSFIRKITFFKDYTIFVDKEWLLKNDLLLFPLFLSYDEDELDLFNKANKHKKFYISGIDFERETHRELKPISSYTEVFLSPDFIYEVESKSFDLSFMQPPEYFLVINSDFNLGIIYDSDLGEYYIFGNKKNIEEIFGNLNTFIINNQLEKEKLFYRDKYYNKNSYSKEMKFYIEYYSYYESVLIEKKYLKDSTQKKAEARLIEITNKIEEVNNYKTVESLSLFLKTVIFEDKHDAIYNSKATNNLTKYSKYVNSLTQLVKKATPKDKDDFLPNKKWIIENNLFAFPLFIKPEENLLKLFNIANKYEKLYILAVNSDAEVREVNKYTPSLDFIYENVDFLTYFHLMLPTFYYFIINSDFSFGILYKSYSEGYYIFGKKEKIESMFGNLDLFIKNNYLERKEFLNSLDYKFDYKKIFDYYNSILQEQGYFNKN